MADETTLHGSMTALDDYLALPRYDRAAIYRSLSVSDRMRLDRQIRERKSRKSENKAVSKRKLRKLQARDSVSGAIAETEMSSQGHLSPWLLAHLRSRIDDVTSLGAATREYLIDQIGAEEGGHV